MPVTKVEASEAECDGCGKVQLFTPADEPIDGFYITWTEVNGRGANGSKLYTCSEKCVPKAFKKRLEIQDRLEGRE